jgi:acetoin utilization protein AcuC
VLAPRVLVIADEALGRYGFPNGHSFGTDRLGAFLTEYRARGLAERCMDLPSRVADDTELLLFHTERYLAFVRARSADGAGMLDEGDTPAFRGCYEIAARVVGATLDAAQALLAGQADRAFVPIAGLHHAARDKAAGFCVFNDIGVLIEVLRRSGIRRVAYVDIDAHHGDGVFYPFEGDPFVVVADLHEDGQFLYPGTGRDDETGAAEAIGSKLNVPLPPGADDAAFAAAWPAVLAHLERAEPAFIILQCGADSLGGDPLAHLLLTPASHRLAATSLAQLAQRLGHGRLLALGGGGYNRANIAAGWNSVVEALLQS